MKAANQEYFEFGQDGKLVQLTFKVSTEQMYIEIVKLYRSYDMEMPDKLLFRAEIAINRLLQYEASYA